MEIIEIIGIANLIVQVIIAIIAFRGIFTAIRQNTISRENNEKQLKIFNEQAKLDFFAEYTRRYQEVILNLPINIFENDFDYEVFNANEKEKILRYMRVYFDLCSEEYFLNEKDYLDTHCWKSWEEGIKYSMSRKAFKDAWDIINGREYYDDFQKWIQKDIR